MKTAFLSCCGVFAVFLVPVAAYGDIREPSLEELSKDAEVIVEAHVKVTAPALFSTTGVFVMSLVLFFGILWWARRTMTKSRAVFLATLTATVSAVVGLLFVCSLPHAHQSMGLAEVRNTLKGSTSPYIAVFYNTNFACDVSELASGNDYVLFLKSHFAFGYRMSWYDCSVWKITGDSVQNVRRSWDGMAPIQTERFFNDVRKACQ
jgi:hypothetical protein